MSTLGAYRENLEESRRELKHAAFTLRALGGEGAIFYGEKARPGREPYVGWLIRQGSPVVDRAFTAWVKADGDFRHWRQRVFDEERAGSALCIDCEETQRRMNATGGRHATEGQLEELRGMR